MTKPIRVLHILEDHDAIGGAEELVTTLLVALRDSGRIDPEVALISPDRLAARLAERKIVVHDLGNDGAVRKPLANKLTEIVSAGKFQIVQSHLLKMNTLNALAASGHTARTVGTCHGLLKQELTLRSRFYGMWAGWKLDQTVCVSHKLARQYRSAYFVPRSRVTVIPNAYDASRMRAVSAAESADFRAQLGIVENEEVIVAVGNIAPVKGYGELIDAIAILVDDHPEVPLRLLIAGAMREPETLKLRRLAAENELGDRVRFLGEFRDLSLLFSIAALYVSSSHREGFSLTTVEAMAAGIPVVVTDSGGPAEIVDDGKGGWLVPVRDAVALSDSISDALRNKEESHRLMEYAKLRVETEYTPARLTERTLALYDRLLSLPTRR